MILMLKPATETKFFAHVDVQNANSVQMLESRTDAFRSPPKILMSSFLLTVSQTEPPIPVFSSMKRNFIHSPFALTDTKLALSRFPICLICIVVQPYQITTFRVTSIDDLNTRNLH